MPQVTITDIKEIKEMTDRDILEWMLLHKQSLKTEQMEKHWDEIKKDLEKLEEEYELRNPMINILIEINKTLKEIQDTLKPNVTTGPK